MTYTVNTAATTVLTLGPTAALLVAAGVSKRRATIRRRKAQRAAQRMAVRVRPPVRLEPPGPVQVILARTASLLAEDLDDTLDVLTALEMATPTSADGTDLGYAALAALAVAFGAEPGVIDLESYLYRQSQAAQRAEQIDRVRDAARGAVTLRPDTPPASGRPHLRSVR